MPRRRWAPIVLLAGVLVLWPASALEPGPAPGTFASSLQAASVRSFARRADQPTAPIPTPTSAATPTSTPTSISTLTLTPAELRAHVADAAFSRFIAVYWNPGARAFYAHSDHSPGSSGPFADFWWTANLWETVMDRFERTGAVADRRLLDAVYDGFVERHPSFANDWNDDLGWWALAATRAYALTNERRFLDRARTLFATIWDSWDRSLGGGIWWRRTVHGEKNVATNAPAIVTALRLWGATGDATYRSRAVAIYRWLDARLRQGDKVDDHVDARGRVAGSDFTYNYGTFLGAALELGRAVGSATLRAAADAVADRAVTGLTTDGIFRDEGAGDGGGFKGILVRNLARMAMAEPGSRARLRDILGANADAAWASRRADGLVGSSWSMHPAGGAIDTPTVGSAVTLFELAASIERLPGGRSAAGGFAR